jgi:hypothetical protein
MSTAEWIALALAVLATVAALLIFGLAVWDTERRQGDEGSSSS